MIMILSSAFAVAFFYFSISVLKAGWPIVLYFSVIATIVHVFYKGKHFKTAEINLFFLYIISLLYWLKGIPTHEIFKFIYLLAGASLLFTISDKLWSVPLRISGWILVSFSVALLMYERFGSWPLSLLMAVIVIPIALRDRERFGESKN